MPHNVGHFIWIVLCTVQFFVSIGLIIVVTMQDSKNDGLTGQIGTTAATSFKGKAGREEQLNLITRNLAIAFCLIAIVVALTTKHWS
ncbi:MAG TPA: preprotein translocase subunit SecG [Chthonomonadaceae bacterium]|nr:preprotein translocase subunit SecG [Chthonomonadaceae bacterium]